MPYHPGGCADFLSSDFAALCASLYYPAWNGGLSELLYDLGSFAAAVATVAQLHTEPEWKKHNAQHFSESRKVLAFRLTLPETH